jgi:hypothetical protein
VIEKRRSPFPVDEVEKRGVESVHFLTTTIRTI